jgi:ACS family tartrate transporter-like MFS transporter
VLCEVPSNLILVRVGARSWIARIMVSWGILSAMTAFVWNGPSYDTARLLLGAAEAGFLPGALFYLTNWFPRAYRTRIFGTVSLAMPISSVIGAPVSSFILQSAGGLLHLQSWQWLFIFEGLPAFIMGIVVFLFLPSTPEQAAWLSPAECAALQSTLAAERANRERSERFTNWQVLRDGRVWLMCAMAFGLVVGNTGYAIWMPQIIHSLGASTIETGLLTAVPSLVAVIAMAFCAWNADRTGERVWHVAGAFLVSGAGFALAALAHSPALKFLGLILGAAGVTGSSPAFWFLPAALLTSTATAVGLALINSTGSIGGFFGPAVIGWVREATGNFTAPLLCLAAAMVVTAVLALILGRWMRDILHPGGRHSRRSPDAATILSSKEVIS